MKFKITEPIMNYEGKPFMENEKPVTYRAIFNLALNSFQQDEKPTAEEKAQAFQLTMKIFSSNEIDLTVEERALIQKRVDMNYNYPLFIGRTKEFLGDK